MITNLFVGTVSFKHEFKTIFINIRKCERTEIFLKSWGLSNFLHFFLKICIFFLKGVWRKISTFERLMSSHGIYEKLVCIWDKSAWVFSLIDERTCCSSSFSIFERYPIKRTLRSSSTRSRCCLIFRTSWFHSSNISSFRLSFKISKMRRISCWSSIWRDEFVRRLSSSWFDIIVS